MSRLRYALSVCAVLALAPFVVLDLAISIRDARRKRADDLRACQQASGDVFP